jgi:hypothetical protein
MNKLAFWNRRRHAPTEEPKPPRYRIEKQMLDGIPFNWSVQRCYNGSEGDVINNFNSFEAAEACVQNLLKPSPVRTNEIVKEYP